MGRLRRGRFDIVVDLQGLLRSGILSRVTGAPRRIGLSDAREGARFFYNEIVDVPRTHSVDRYLCAARHLGCEAAPIEFPLGVSTQVKSEGLIAVNPSARWETKLWGNDKFAELVRRLPRDRVVLTGSSSERDTVEAIAQGNRNLAGQPTSSNWRNCIAAALSSLPTIAAQCTLPPLSAPPSSGFRSD